jgi:hypothetical protein
MTESAVQQAAETAVPKHRSLLRTGRDGRVLSALMLPLVWLRPPAGMGVITTTGRKTGKPRRKCVRVIQRGDLRGLPNRAKVQELHRFWFDTGILLAIDLRKPS